MNDLQRPLRLWLGLTVAFVVTSAVLVSWFAVDRLIDFDRGGRDAYRRLIHSYLIQEYSRIAEEMYLKLPTLQLHEDRLNELMDVRGHVTLSLAAVEAGSSAEREVDRLAIEFGDVPLGELQIVIDWKPTLSTATGQSTMLQLCGLIVVMVLLSVGISLYLNKRVIAPLWLQLLELQRTRTIAATVGMIAHDVRKPFSLVKLGTRYALDATDDEARVDRLQRLAGRVDTALSDVNAMLEDVLVAGGIATLHLSDFSLRELVAETIAEIAPRFAPKGIYVSVATTDVGEVNADRHKMKRALANIVENAFQATPNGGRIDVMLSRGKRLIEISIRNSGSFIEDADRAKIFDSFFTKGKAKGTGLGLAIVKQIVEAHGGRVSCQSSRSTGTEFSFRLAAALSATTATVVSVQ